MNIVKSTMNSYKSCVNWLREYESERDHFIKGLSNAKGISYEYQPGGTPLTMDMKNSINSDKIAEWDRERKRTKEHCESVITMCDEWVQLVHKRYGTVFDYWMRTDASLEWIAERTKYSRARVYQIINEETLRIASLED